MDFSLSAEQRELCEAAVAFARRELDQDVAKREAAGEFSPEAWRACAKFGVQGMPVPPELGGGGADVLSTVLVMGGTRRVLVSNPFQVAYEEPAYRTGDLVTLDDEGNWVFLGRRDGMVKTRGYRVELGEVETALYAHPAIREAVVVPVPDELLGSRLRAVISADGPGLTRDEVLDHCRQRLPGYMVPDVVEFCEALPRTSSGKVDRARLTGHDS